MIVFKFVYCYVNGNLSRYRYVGSMHVTAATQTIVNIFDTTGFYS